MRFFGLARAIATAIFLCVAMGGCVPSGNSQSDEQKEPHFLAGRNLVSQMDFPGAIEAFEKALEVNPRSASAHFELGVLYEQNAGDPAAAIYHYERFLKLRPNSSEADLARGRINSCKLELARSVSALAALPPATQREMEKILLENKDLKLEIARLQALTSAPAAQTPAAAQPAPLPQRPAESAPADAAPRAPSTPRATPVSNRAPEHSAQRTHVVKAGDNPSAIARKYGITLTALMAANPQAKPTRLQIGQVLNIPSP